VCDDQSDDERACALHLASNGEVTRECGDATVMANNRLVAATRHPATGYTIGPHHLIVAPACGRSSQLFSNGEAALGVGWRRVCWGNFTASLAGEACSVGSSGEHWVVGCHSGLSTVTSAGLVTIAEHGKWSVVTSPSGLYAIGESDCVRWTTGQRESCTFRCAGELVANGDLVACSESTETETRVFSLATGAVVDTVARRSRVRSLSQTHLLYSDGSGRVWLHQIGTPSACDEMVFGTRVGWGGEGQTIALGPSAAWLLGNQIVVRFAGELVLLQRERR
jgi:hypothetical protein